MTQRIVRIAPVQAGKVAAVLYASFSLFFLPFLLLPSPPGGKNPFTVWSLLMFIPVYVIAGFLMTAFMAWLYNLIARWAGGLEIVLEEHTAQ